MSFVRAIGWMLMLIGAAAVLAGIGFNVWMIVQQTWPTLMYLLWMVGGVIAAAIGLVLLIEH